MQIIFNILSLLLTILILAVISAAPVMWLWDWLMPTLFGLTTITLGQSLGLSFLCSLLFKSSKE